VSRIHFLVEGQTEETVVGDLFEPHFRDRGWDVTYSILKTKRVAGQAAYKGGVRNWSQIERDLRLLFPSRFDLVTTIIDYYGCPSDTPGMSDRPAGSDARARVAHVEEATRRAIGHPSFLPNLVLHETEAWVLAASDELGAALDDPAGAAAVKKMVEDCGGPELVNDRPESAPSKRLLTNWPTYKKTLDGPLALSELGLARLRIHCPHLDAWPRRIEEWPTSR
jgi:hypothetical protein